jgi:hypothetical protein
MTAPDCRRQSGVKGGAACTTFKHDSGEIIVGGNVYLVGAGPGDRVGSR